MGVTRKKSLRKSGQIKMSHEPEEHQAMCYF